MHTPGQTPLSWPGRSYGLFLLAALVASGCAPRDIRATPTSMSSALPAAPTSAPPATSSPPAASAPTPFALLGPTTGGSAVVVFVEDGDVLVWDQATGHRQVIIDSGDVIRVELSDDGQLVAFVRRSYFAAEGYNQNEQSALWVVDRDGSNPRQVVSAEELRAQVNAAEADSTNFPRLVWIPNTKRLLYSGNTYEAHGYGEGAHTSLKGVYVVDTDTLVKTVLAPAESDLESVPSPDGQQVALLSTTGLSFVSVDGSRRRQDVLTYPAVGVPQKLIPTGVWIQDSGAFLIVAPIESGSQTSLNFTLWRVPIDGGSASPLTTLTDVSPNVVFAPAGSAAAFYRYALPGAGGGPEVNGWFIAQLPEDLGPLALPRQGRFRAIPQWSPDSTAYVVDPADSHNLSPLCPGAAQFVEICGRPIRLPNVIESLQWLDRTRFLYMTAETRQLYLATVDGSATAIVADPQSFAAVASTCRNEAEFVSDVTVLDGTHFGANTLFRKTWRIRNSGTCAWDDSYRLTFLSGDRMWGPRSAPLGDTVQPGDEVDVSVSLITPTEAGTYRGQWQLFAPDGKPFGTTPYVLIVVP